MCRPQNPVAYSNCRTMKQLLRCRPEVSRAGPSVATPVAQEEREELLRRVRDTRPQHSMPRDSPHPEPRERLPNGVHVPEPSIALELSRQGKLLPIP